MTLPARASGDEGVSRPEAAIRRSDSDRRERRGGLRGRLNLFQAMVLRWRELHPYVAVHMIGVPHPLEAARLKEAIGGRLEEAGLARIELDRLRRRFEFRPGPAAVELRVLSAGSDPHEAVRAEIERQLNGAFPSEGTFTPFRFFVVDRGPAFDLGVAYDHFIAGGDSIAVLLERLFEAYAPGESKRAAPWAPRRYPGTYRRLFLRDFGHSLRGLARLPAMAASCRRSARAPCHTDRPATEAFLCYGVPEREFSALLRTAKAWGVTVNDLVLAMLLLALASVVPRRDGDRRNELGVASIVNLRREFESDAKETFGLFLASLRISHAVPSGVELRRLAGDVHAETERIKKEKLYLQTLLGLGWTAIAWRFLSPERRRRFLAKHYPIWAGVTSLNIDPLWTETALSRTALEYVRAVPTGPLAPLAFAITTFRGRMQVGVSYRIADLSADTARRVADALLGLMHGLG
ncbi:MAG TPA: hypothetical protein VMN79_01905 [Casimicrobiaceae bacterium]|nr:hypothetical protein [Casimicrobiaceae bacterium]